MSNLNRMYGKLKTPDDWMHTEDFTFRVQQIFDPSSTNEQKADITFSNVDLDLSKVQGSVAAYLVIRHVFLAVRKNRVYQGALKGYSWTQFNGVTIPANTVGNIQTFSPIPSFPYAMTNLKKLLLTSFGANITVTKVEIKSNAQAEWVDLATGNIAAPQGIDMETIFGTAEGFPAHSRNVTNQGIDLRFTTNNSHATNAQQFVYVGYGTSDTSQTNQWLVQYRDRNGGIHNIGIFDDLQFAANFEVNRIIPVPITDPTRPDFGAIVMTPIISGEDYYVTGDQYNVIVDVSIAYLLPEDAISRRFP